MNFGSVCSGIEAASQAWTPLGWRAQFVSEIDDFPNAVLEQRCPGVPNHGDMMNFERWPDAALDLLVGGTPCQSYSLAGLRKGLGDPRGGLMLAFGAVAKRYRPEWLLWENVPGVLSSNGGRDFGSFLGMLGVLGYGFAYRVFDAQHFGLAQSRRRVFVVASSRGWQRAAAVLFQRESLWRHPSARAETGEGDSDDSLPGAADGGERDAVIPRLAKCITAGEMQRQDFETCTILPARAPAVIPFDTTQITCPTNRSRPRAGALCHTLAAGAHPPAVAAFDRVRRLTPRECERLQGFPDDYTQVQFRGKTAEDCPDGPRYRALGNSIAVPCLSWLAKRIELVREVAP